MSTTSLATLILAQQIAEILHSASGRTTGISLKARQETCFHGFVVEISFGKLAPLFGFGFLVDEHATTVEGEVAEGDVIDYTAVPERRC